MTTRSLQGVPEQADARDPRDRPARVLALLARRPGDNAQVEALAAASGLSWRPVRLGLHKGLEALPNLRPGGSLFSYDRATQAALRSAAPDVVIAAGKRSAPAALWLKAATGARLVHLGRTWAPTGWFDQVVTTAQYRQGRGPNVIENRFPLTAPIDRSGAALDPELEALERPRLLAIAGGNAPPLVLDAGVAGAFVEAALDRAKNSGGSLLVATSPRTSVQAVRAIRETLLRSNASWRLTVFGEARNDYRAFLEAADRLFVTDDTVSMVAEAAATGRPVELFALPTRSGVPAAIRSIAERGWASLAVAERLVDFGLVASGRDLRLYMTRLAGSGLLEGGEAAAERMAAELDAAAATVRLFAKIGPRPAKAAVPLR